VVQKRPGEAGYLQAGVRLLNRASNPSLYLTIEQIVEAFTV
jgi:hypothetical protein